MIEDEGPVFLPGALARYSGGDEDFEREALATFLENARRLLDRLESPDGEDLRRAAHTLKGNSRSVGALRLGRACEDLEDELALPAPAPAAHIEEVARRFEELLTWLEDHGRL